MLAIIGIVVSVVLFFIGYRQTVGAKKERVAAANRELERILLRRIVLEKYTPNLSDISRLIEGKARDYRVRPEELISETQLLNTIYARVTESDLIPSEKRDEILEIIMKFLSAAEVEPVQEKALEVVVASKRLWLRTNIAITIMAILASLVGGLISVIPALKTFPVEIPKVLLIATVLGGLVAIALSYAISRFRAAQEEIPSKESYLSEYLTFESNVRKMLQEFGTVIQPSGMDKGFDFIVKRGEKTILIEVKDWSKPVPNAILGRVASRLRDVARKIKTTELIIVTKSSIETIGKIKEIEEGEVKIMTLRELRNYLSSL